MGLMAVGAVCFLEPLTDPDEEDTLAPEDTHATDDISPPLDQSTSAATLTADETDTDGGTFDPDYDSRGGDDGALLEPVVIDDADTVELVEGSNSDDQIDSAEGNDRIQGLDGDDNLNAAQAMTSCAVTVARMARILCAAVTRMTRCSARMRMTCCSARTATTHCRGPQATMNSMVARATTPSAADWMMIR